MAGPQDPSSDGLGEMVRSSDDVMLERDEVKEAKALLGWVKAVDEASEEGILTRHVATIQDLSDGVVFSDILSAVDHAYFRNPHTAESRDSWVIKIATLKRLYKAVMQYYAEVLGQSPRALAVPDLDALARDSSPTDLCKLGQLILGIAVRSDRASEHINAIQTLPLEDQQQLMFTIEQVMQALLSLEDDAEGQAADQQGDDGNAFQSRSEEEERLQRQYTELLADYRSLKGVLEEAVAEKQDTKRELALLQEQNEKNRVHHADILMRQEIERLKTELHKSEDNLGEAEMQIEKLRSTVTELTKKGDEWNKKAEDYARVQDQLEELKHSSERLAKAENVIEKFKKKIEEGADVRRQLKTVESQYAELIDRNAAVEDEYKRVAAFKPLMDQYKSQLADMESKESNLQRELTTSRYDVEELTRRLRIMEDARAKDKEELDLYQERIEELELRSGSGQKRSRGNGDGDVNGVEGLAANNASSSSDDNDSDEMIDENIDDAFNGVTMTGLKIQVRKLARELKAAKANKADAGRLLVVENLLEDATKMKGRYEQQYLQEYQKNLLLQRRMEEIMDGKASIGDGPEANHALRLRLNETVDELDKIKREQIDLTDKYSTIKRDLDIATSNLNLAGMDKVDMLKTLREEVSAEKEKLEQNVQRMTEEMAQKEQQIQMDQSQINALLLDKVGQQSTTIEQQQEALQRQREADTARSALSTEGQAMLAAKNEELGQTKEKLQKARDFIREQDHLIREAQAQTSTNKSSEAQQKEVSALKKIIASLRQEQKMMAATWFTSQSQANRESMLNSVRRNGSAVPTKAALRLTGSKPSSWLQQQRFEQAGGIISLGRR